MLDVDSSPLCNGDTVGTSRDPDTQSCLKELELSVILWETADELEVEELGFLL